MALVEIFRFFNIKIILSNNKAKLIDLGEPLFLPCRNTIHDNFESAACQWINRMQKDTTQGFSVF